MISDYSQDMHKSLSPWQILQEMEVEFMPFLIMTAITVLHFPHFEKLYLPTHYAAKQSSESAAVWRMSYQCSHNGDKQEHG